MAGATVIKPPPLRSCPARHPSPSPFPHFAHPCLNFRELHCPRPQVAMDAQNGRTMTFSELRELASQAILVQGDQQVDLTRGVIVPVNVPVLVVSADEPEHVPRPMNAFMLFRQQMQSSVREQQPQLNNCQVSKVVAQLWRNLTPEQRLTYHRQAAKLKEEHEARHPNWRYKPKRAKRPSSGELDCIVNLIKSLPPDLLSRLYRTEIFSDLCRKDRDDFNKAATSAFADLKEA